MYQCICGKEFEHPNSFNGHKSHCETHLRSKYGKNFGIHRKKRDNSGYYKCECGQEFDNQNSYCGHCTFCEIHLGKERSFINKNTSKRIKSNDSGKRSYIQYNGIDYFLRSVPEFIFAIWCYVNHFPISVERIRVPAVRENKFATYFISDFNIGNKIFEIKSVKTDKDILIQESFEASGYEFKILYPKDIKKLKDEIILTGFDLKSELEKVIDGHKIKKYYKFIIS